MGSTRVKRARIDVDGTPCWGTVEGEIIRLDKGGEVAIVEAQWLAPAEPTKIMAVHLTYRSRLTEYAAKTPAEPSYFMKPPTTLNHHLGEIRRPRGTRYLNYEGEIAVVVGREMKGVPPAKVHEYVLGFTPANDVGLHDFRHADRGSMLRVKGQDGFLPLGPILVTADEWTPDDGFRLTTRVDGEVVQSGDQDDLIWDYRYQLADLCRVITLLPGDVVLTGTPANSRPMEAGTVVEVEIDGLPALRNTVVDWDVDLAGPGDQPETSANTLHVALAIPEDEAERRVAAGEVD